MKNVEKIKNECFINCELPILDFFWITYLQTFRSACKLH